MGIKNNLLIANAYFLVLLFSFGIMNYFWLLAKCAKMNYAVNLLEYLRKAMAVQVNNNLCLMWEVHDTLNSFKLSSITCNNEWES